MFVGGNDNGIIMDNSCILHIIAICHLPLLSYWDGKGEFMTDTRFNVYN